MPPSAGPAPNGDGAPHRRWLYTNADQYWPEDEYFQLHLDTWYSVLFPQRRSFWADRAERHAHPAVCRLWRSGSGFGGSTS